MTTSSIFHFFARLMERRGYFVQDNELQDFTFPAYMIAAKSDGGFPDFVLRTNSKTLTATAYPRSIPLFQLRRNSCRLYLW